MIDLKTILYPTDFSDYSRHALPYVTEFARRFDAEIIVQHTIGVPAYAGAYEIAIDVTTLRESILKDARAKLTAMTAELQKEGLRVTGELAEGAAFVEIVRVARERNASLIIIPTHGWGVLKHVLLGSTAEKVVRKAPCPVLTLRHPEHEFIHP